MKANFVTGIRLGILIVTSAIFVGCAFDNGAYPPTQSLEAAVQGILTKQGYYQGPIDATIGPSTSRAIRNYQRDHKLTQTGTINPALTTSMGLTGGVYPPPGYPVYSSYLPWYAGPNYYAPPGVIGVGWQGYAPNRGGYYHNGGYCGRPPYNHWGGSGGYYGRPAWR